MNRVELRGSDYRVRLAIFEGSLSALLELLRAGEITPEEVPLALIGQDYLEHLRRLQDPEPDREGEAVLSFALLIWTKLQGLLPGGTPVEEEVLDEETVQALMEQHQRRYAEVQQVSEWLAARAAGAQLSVPRPAAGSQPAGTPPDEALPQKPLNPQLLVEGLRRVLERLPREVEVPVQRIDWERIVNRVRERLAAGRQVLFEELIMGASRREVIASFLAILELVRLGEARIWQDELFGPIYVAPREVVVRS